MGCFSAGLGNDVFDNGLTLFNVNSLTLTPSLTNKTSNGFYLIMYSSMTLEMCISICRTNGFAYAGLKTWQTE